MTDLKDTASAQVAAPAGIMISIQTQLREQQIEADWLRRRVLMLSQMNADLGALNEQLSAELAAARQKAEELKDEIMGSVEQPETEENTDGE